MRPTGRRPVRWRRPREARAVLALALLLAGPRDARAAQETGAGAASEAAAPPVCPERDAILSALRKLGSRDDPGRIADAAVRAGLEIEDFGDRFRVTVAGRAREYRDADRDCQHRARLAAVFSALVLAPEGDGAGGSETSKNPSAEPAPAPAPPAPPPAVIVAAPPPPEAAPAAERYALTVAPTVALAPHRGSALAAAGLALGAARLFGRSSVAIALAVPVLPADLTVGGTAVRLDRYPLRLLVGRGVQRGRVNVAVQAGAVAALLRVQRVGPAPTSSTTRLEAGAHLGLGAALALGRVGLYLSIATDWIPRTYPITLDPEGEVDRTPGVWVAGEAGLRFTFH